jgi:hypothetical protein
MGPLPKSNDCDYLMVIIDWLTSGESLYSFISEISENSKRFFTEAITTPPNIFACEDELLQRSNGCSPVDVQAIKFIGSDEVD